jgi:uncharacterized cupin superfamily protein
MKKHLLKAEEIQSQTEEVRVHPLNPNAVRHFHALGDAVGMKRLGVHIARIEPGHDTTEFHFHYHEEEFLYILSGRGIARIGDEEAEVGPGDFMGFTAPSLPHGLKNPFDEDLVYLMGGERLPYDVVDYPNAKKRLYRGFPERQMIGWEHLQKS